MPLFYFLSAYSNLPLISFINTMCGLSFLKREDYMIALILLKTTVETNTGFAPA